MNLNSPFLTPAFNGGATSALSRIPTPFRSFPGGNIGYANRLEGVGDLLDDALDWTKQFVGEIGEQVGDIGKTWVRQQLSEVKRKSLENLGYRFGAVVEVTVNGEVKQGVTAKKRDGTWVVVFSDGSEIPWTTGLQSTARPVNPATGMTSGTAIAIGAVAIGVIALLLFKRR